jgi:hypothetical protein
MFACQLPGRRACNRSRPLFNCALRCRYYKLSVETASGWTGCREGLADGSGCAQKRQPPFVEAFLAAPPRPRAPAFSVAGARTEHKSRRDPPFCPHGPLGRARTAERPWSTRQSALAAAAWPRARVRPSPGTRQNKAQPSRPQRLRARRRRHTNTTKAQPTQPCDRAARSQARVPTTKR